MPNLNQHKRALILLCAVAAVSGCATVEPVIVAKPGVAFSLPVGKSATINGNGTKLTFTRVTQDSRCPTDVTCVWEGEAQIEVNISRTGSPDETAILRIRGGNGEEKSSGNLVIRFVGLTPVPRQADGNASRAYVAELIVNQT